MCYALDFIALVYFTNNVLLTPIHINISSIFV